MIKHLTSNRNILLTLLVIVIIGVLAVGRLSTPIVHAAGNPDSYVCEPSQVGVFTNRVAVKCKYPVKMASGGGFYYIYYWAYPTSDSLTASLLLNLFETARSTGSPITLYYNRDDLSGSKIGCLNKDCRIIWGATLP